MKEDGLEIQLSSESVRSPFDGLEMLDFLQDGGFVGMAGDLSWAKDPRREKATLFGREVLLPVAPHMMALLTGVPIFTYFAFRTARNKFLIEVSEPRWVRAESRGKRKEAIRQSVHEYAESLEEAIRRFPWQWHVFEPFFGPPAG